MLRQRHPRRRSLTRRRRPRPGSRRSCRRQHRRTRRWAPRAPTAFDVPAWPPAASSAAASLDFEDWVELGGATSGGTQEREQPQRGPDEVSVIDDQNAIAQGDHQPTKRAPTYPILTSEQSTTTSGAFVMPTPAPPVVAPAAWPPPTPSSRAERPTSPAIPAAAAFVASPPHAAASSTAWHTPLPLAPPPPEPAPQWPSAAGLEYNGAHGSEPDIPLPTSSARHEPRFGR